MEREFVTDSDACTLSSRWGVDMVVMEKLLLSAQDFEAETRGAVKIVSGLRTAAEQKALRRKGRPTAPDDVSTHLSCPATGVDISLGLFPTRVQKAIWGRIITMNGLRWGGGGPVDDGGIPIDWQHLDAGPRS